VRNNYVGAHAATFPTSIHDVVRRAQLCGALDGLAEAGVDAQFGAATEKARRGYLHKELQAILTVIGRRDVRKEEDRPLVDGNGS
jgi:hypothetical protein